MPTDCDLLIRNQMNKQIIHHQQAVQKAKIKLIEVVKSIQKTCNHTTIAECGYQPLSLGDCLVPIRICLHCGMTEDGWYCGYQILKVDRPIEITRSELYRIRIGLNISNDLKGSLISGEVTVNELIDKGGDL